MQPAARSVAPQVDR